VKRKRRHNIEWLNLPIFCRVNCFTFLPSARSSPSRSSLSSLPSLRPSRHADQVDAIPIPLPIRQIVPQVRTVHAHRLPVAEAPHVVPNDLLVAEARPAVTRALLQEGLHVAAAGRHEQRLSGVGIVEGYLPLGRLGVRNEGRGRPVPRVLGVVPVEVAYAIGGVVIAVPSEVLLHRRGGRAVGLLGHDRLVPHDAGGGVRLLAEHAQRRGGGRDAGSSGDERTECGDADRGGGR